jgi:cytochrome P450
VPKGFEAVCHELLIYLADHPLALLLAEISRPIAVVHVPGLGYIVNDLAIARQILEREDAFSKTGPGSMGAMISQVVGASALMNMDGADHLALRAKLTDLFSAAYLDSITTQALAEPAAMLRQDLEAGRRVDLVRFMHLLSGRMMCHMLGINPPRAGQAETYLEMFDAGRQLTSPPGLFRTRLTPTQVAERRARFERLVAYGRDAYERAGANSDSVLQRLRQFGLAFEEVKGVLAALFTVGTQTISAAVPRIVSLLVDTGQMTRLRQSPQLLATAVDEGLRYTVPSPISLRSVAHDHVLVNGHHFRGGRRVLILTYNIMKQPRWCTKPRQFDITRVQDRNARHLWFGAGPHFCLGFNLAQREIRTVLKVFMELSGEVRVAKRRYARNVLVPAYASLEVELRSRRGASAGLSNQPADPIHHRVDEGSKEG